MLFHKETYKSLKYTSIWIKYYYKFKGRITQIYILNEKINPHMTPGTY